MALHRNVILWLLSCSLVTGTLFNGQSYTGSAAQLAELDAITAKAKARATTARDHFLALLREPVDVAPALDRISAISAQQIADAQEIVDHARDMWQDSYRQYVASPRRNVYPKNNKNGAAGRSKSRLSSADNSALQMDPKIAKAAALLAEANAASKYKTGALYTDYSKTFDHKNAPPHVQFVNSSMYNAADTAYWMDTMNATGHGQAPFAGDANYPVFRSVKSYGAKGDGVTDDTDAFNKAIQDGKRCGADCLSSTKTPALVYIPAGTYLISSTIIGLFNTQIVGNPNNLPVIKASADFVGKDGTNGIITSDYYIDGGGGQEWYLPVSNFYRQIRNLRIDISDVKADNASCIHWQVGQATSIENVNCIMSNDGSTTQRGIFAENGSGGYMGDITFSGGAIGIYGGEQQFTANSMYFSHCQVAVQMIWDWGYSWRTFYVIGANIAFKLVSDDGTHGIGSIHLQDGTIESTKIGIQVFPESNTTYTGNTAILLDNVAFSHVTSPVIDTNGKSLLSGSDGFQVDVWSVGSQYALGDNYWDGETDIAGATGAQVFSLGSNLKSRRDGDLINDPTSSSFSESWYLYKKKPQYGDADISTFLNAKDYGAKGDGKTDDTAAFQALFGYISAERGGVIFIPHGVYLLSDTIQINLGTVVLGECWPQLMATGSKFAEPGKPRPLIRAGLPAGDVGVIELSDLLITQQGKTSSLVGIEWNIIAPNVDNGKKDIGQPGIWDVHFRAGGAVGGGLQVDQCPAGSDASCTAGALMMHITPQGGGYFQNMWLWVADHDIDDDFNTQINIMFARGLLVESTKPIWMYGTAVEHATTYQYQFNNAKGLIASMIQTESPYFQGLNGIGAIAPFGGNMGEFPGDPPGGIDRCLHGGVGCDASWGLRILNSSDITIGGAGLYSWFDGYDESCVDTRDCQNGMVQIGEGSDDIKIYNLITIGAQDMVNNASTDSNLETVSAGDNLYSPTHPWWSIVNVLGFGEIAGGDVDKIFPPHRSFFALGDSYAAGIGASCDYTGGWVYDDDPLKGYCYKCIGAYSYQLHQDRVAFSDKGYKFYACSGGTTGGVQDPSTQDGFFSQVHQMKEFGDFADYGWSTLSIGGNNVGFAEVADKCLVFDRKDCDSAWADSDARIASDELQKNLTDTYRQILSTVTDPNYQLYVTGYGRFFNADTPEYDKNTMLSDTMCVLFGPCSPVTTARRKRANDGVLALNDAILKATNTVWDEEKAKGSNKKVIFVDVDHVYNGHRFCEPGYSTPDSDKTWFFNVATSDIRADLSVLMDDPSASHPSANISSIDTKTCTSPSFEIPDVPARDLLCTLAGYFQANPGKTIQVEDPASGLKQNLTAAASPYWVLKAFHPKTAAHALIAEVVWDYYRLHNNIWPPPTKKPPT